MPPPILRVAIGPSRSPRLPVLPKLRTICPICSISRSRRVGTPTRGERQVPQQPIRYRQQSNVASTSKIDGQASVTSNQARAKLRDALIDLQKQAGSYVNISRLQLALRGLEQTPGQETVRIAILGLRGGNGLRKAKELLRLLVADPLKPEEEWERILTNDEPGNKPLLLRVGLSDGEELPQYNRMIQELHVSSAMLNGHKLEILVFEMDPLYLNSTVEDETGREGRTTASILVPTMEIPTSSTGRYTPVTTPVHRSLVVGEGITGAAELHSYPQLGRELVAYAVDLRCPTDEASSLPFQILNVALGSEALRSFRQDVGNAIEYEKGWFASGVPEILQWLKSGTSSAEGKLKEPIRILIDSLLIEAREEIDKQYTRLTNTAMDDSIQPKELDSLRNALSGWAERAHTELRDQLDIAFDGRRWRKLGWWKLFWRVDDVSMIAFDILAQRFLTNAEKEVIYLAGRIDQGLLFRNGAPVITNKNWAYKPVVEKHTASYSPPPRIRDLVATPDDDLQMRLEELEDKPWPLSIPATRNLLASDTVPALQALAQKLVLQTLTTSAFSTAFAGLMYVSTLSTGLYEAGGVAALGIVWSLRRMQGKWETARRFWEGEVREEGRKAVRDVESIVNNVLARTDDKVDSVEETELHRAKEAVDVAEEALEVYVPTLN